MSSRQTGFHRRLLAVAIIHGLAIGGLLAFSIYKGCDKPLPDLSTPMELVIEAPMDNGEEPATREMPGKVEEPETPPEDDDIPAPARKVDLLKTPPKKVPPRKETQKKQETRKAEPGKIEISKTLVRRSKLPAGKSKLTAAEVQRLLDRGAKLGNKSTLSDADLRRLLNSDTKFGEGNPATREMVYMDAIKQAMYRAWDQPTSLGIAGLVARVEFTFNNNGSIAGCRLSASSGNATMDESVMRAARSVRRISDVPTEFFASHHRITVAFELTGGN